MQLVSCRFKDEQVVQSELKPLCPMNREVLDGKECRGRRRDEAMVFFDAHAVDQTEEVKASQEVIDYRCGNRDNQMATGFEASGAVVCERFRVLRWNVLKDCEHGDGVERLHFRQVPGKAAGDELKATGIGRL